MKNGYLNRKSMAFHGLEKFNKNQKLTFSEISEAS